MFQKKDITFRAAGLQLSRHVLPVNVEKKILKAMLQILQATTSDQQTSTLRNSINGTILLMLTMIISIQLCKKNGKTFGEVMSHFIVELDEMCILSGFHGNMHIFGSLIQRSMRRFSRIHTFPSPMCARGQLQAPLVLPFLY